MISHNKTRQAVFSVVRLENVTDLGQGGDLKLRSRWSGMETNVRSMRVTRTVTALCPQLDGTGRCTLSRVSYAIDNLRSNIDIMIIQITLTCISIHAIGNLINSQTQLLSSLFSTFMESNVGCAD